MASSPSDVCTAGALTTAMGRQVADAASRDEEDDCRRQCLRPRGRELQRRTRQARRGRCLGRLHALDRADERQRYGLLENVVETALAEIGAVTQPVVEAFGAIVGLQPLLQFLPLFRRRFSIEESGQLSIERQFLEIQQIQYLWE